jgi:lysozyme
VSSTTVKTARWMGAGAIACCVAFTPQWEGMDSVARRDMIGTGHPFTYCNGLTSVDGSVKVGQRFTKEECDKALALALPKYWEKIAACLNEPLPAKTGGSLLDASFNAGPAAVCRSPMVKKMNAGNLRAGCNAFAGWYVRSDGKVRVGLEDRRDGEDFGDKRLSEKGLCLEGLKEGLPKDETTKFDVAAKMINSHLPEPKPAEELIEAAPVMDYPGSSDNATPRAGCGQDGIHCPAVVTTHKHRPVIKREPVCTGWLWFRECK